MDKDRIKEYYKLAWHGWFYSMQRTDLLIVSISGAGIYLTLELLKYSQIQKLENLCIVKSCGAMFVAAIILNFISQSYNRKANENDMLWCDASLADEEEDKEKYLHLAEKFDNWTKWINNFSVFFMLLPLALMVYYLIIYL